MIKSILSITAVVGVCFVASAQNNIDLSTLPAVEDILVVSSNPDADTVIVGLHGGPTDQLYTGDFDYFQDIGTFSVVEMQQFQHVKPEILTNAELTLEEAIVYNDSTVAMLKKVVNHYNDLDKTVVLIGHSFGAFLLPEYLDDYGMEGLHRVIPLAGRLNMNQEVVDAFATGFLATFTDGLQVQVSTQMEPAENLAAMKLQAGIGYNRFVDSLATTDLSKMMYVHGTADQAVGRLLPEEIAFLESKNATVLTIENGSHGAPFNEENMAQVLDFIREPLMVSVAAFAALDPVGKIYPTLANARINVELSQNGTIEMFTLQGQLIKSETVNQGLNTIYTKDLADGYYIVRGIAGGKGFTQKIAVQH